MKIKSYKNSFLGRSIPINLKAFGSKKPTERFFDRKIDFNAREGGVMSESKYFEHLGGAMLAMSVIIRNLDRAQVVQKDEIVASLEALISGIEKILPEHQSTVPMRLLTSLLDEHNYPSGVDVNAPADREVPDWFRGIFDGGRRPD